MIYPQIDSYCSLVPLCVSVVVLIFSKNYIVNVWFTNYIGIFILGMGIVLGCSSVWFILGWELIGILSLILIGWYSRSESMVSGYTAFNYNRLSDIGLILWVIMGEEGSWLLFLAIIAKSAMGVCSRWLPIAMEGPTPVSSLLHSSTIVLASVYLLGVIGNGGYMIVLSVLTLIVGFGSIVYEDINNSIALSTSANLSIMCILVSQGMYGLCIIHIITHAIVKMSMFISSSINIHCSSNQSLYSNSVPVNVLGFSILCGLGCLISSNESSLGGLFSIIFLIISWGYTKRSSMSLCYNTWSVEWIVIPCLSIMTLINCDIYGTVYVMMIIMVLNFIIRTVHVLW